MPEETTPDTGNSVTEAAQIDWDSPDNPYLKRFQDTQSAYTQNQQRLKELELYESDPQAYYKLGAKHGVQFEFEDQQQQGGQESLADYRARLEATEAKLAQFETQQGEQDKQAQWSGWDDHVESLAKESGLKLTEREKTWLMVQTSDPESGFPKGPDETVAVFNGLAEQLKAEQEQRQQEYDEARKRPRVPHTPGGGGAANTAVPDFSQMSKADIDKYMTERVMSS